MFKTDQCNARWDRSYYSTEKVGIDQTFICLPNLNIYSTLIYWRRFNVEISALIHSWTSNIESTLACQCWFTVEWSTLTQRWLVNVDSNFIFNQISLFIQLLHSTLNQRWLNRWLPAGLAYVTWHLGSKSVWCKIFISLILAYLYTRTTPLVR